MFNPLLFSLEPVSLSVRQDMDVETFNAEEYSVRQCSTQFISAVLSEAVLNSVHQCCTQ